MSNNVIKTIKNFFRIDCSKYGEWLLGLPVGEMSENDVVQLADMMNELDGDVVTKGKWKFETAPLPEVIYSGLNSVNFPTHPLYSKVVGINLCGKTRVYFNVGRI